MARRSAASVTLGPDLQTHLNAGLVGVSVAVAILASYAALDLTRRSSGSTVLRKRAWLAAGGATMGIGIWCMHFVGMLSLRMGMPVSYNPGLVIASLAAAVIGASVSLAVVTRPQVSRRGVLSAAAFMGFAVAAMHYLGMAGMQMAAPIHWQLGLVILSVAIGLIASLIALALLVRIRVSSDGFGVTRRLAAAVLLGLGVAGLHYTAMAAASFTAATRHATPPTGLSTNALVLMLAIGAAVMLAVLLGGAAIDQHRAALAGDLTIVATIARELSRTGDSRDRICGAVQALTTADYVILAQPGADQRPTITTSATPHPDATTSTLARDAFPPAVPETVIAVLRAGETITPGLQRLADGDTVHYEQLVLDGDPVGLLAIGWHRDVRRLADRTLTLLSMVAAEAAVALDREELLAKLEHLARRDELTGVLNRRALDEELHRAVTTATRHHRPLSIVMLDLDHFKSYNDTHGHQAGDRLLKDAAAAWTAALRTSDLIARYGGEEFLIILPDCALNDAITVADRLRTATPSHATCSAGVATLDSDSAAQLIGHADHALYESKHAGRDRTSATRPTTQPASRG